ncbi:acyltransferase family protein [Microbulbifer sp. ANSA003]|uniref:acyltransferase family protein n=1 Tax=Microbulbifer sp. ANSA003 TaxID=3243360 RepID=UPI004041923E
MEKLEYRYDVQALRAMSVLFVIIFHASSTLLPGGFLGVDIFFTISGFVIFRLMKYELEGGGFNFT